MADRYWVGGTAAWDATAGTKWATTSGGAGGASVPTSVDDVFFTNLSTGTCTIASGNTGAKSINCTGFTGTLVSNNITVAGSITLSSGMIYTPGGTTTFSGTGTLTTAGKAFSEMLIGNGVGTLTLGDALNIATRSITLTAGTFNTASYAVTLNSIITGGVGVRAVTLNASSVTVSGSFNFASALNFTLNAGTSQINFTGGGGGFSGSGFTFYDVSYTSTATTSPALPGTNTFNNLSITAPTAGIKIVNFAANQTINGSLTTSGTSSTQRVQFGSSVAGTQRTLSVATIGALTNTNWQDIALTGAASPWTAPLGVVDLKNNTGITFDTTTLYWVGGAGTWTDAAKWSTSSGGGGGAGVPGSTNNVVFDASSGAGAVAGNSGSPPNYCANFDCSLASVTTANTVNLQCAGNLKLKSGATNTFSNILFLGTGTHTIDPNGATNISAGGGFSIQGTGTFTLMNNWVSGNAFSQNSGTFNTNGYSLSSNAFTVSGANTKVLNLGASTITITGTSGFAYSGSNLTFNAGTSTISTNGTFNAGAGLTFYNVSLNGTSSTPNISGANTYNNLTLVGPTSASVSAFTLNANQVVNGTFTATGSNGNQRVLVRTNDFITQRTITAATVSLTDTDFQKITGAGGGSWTGTRIGNYGGNSGITFTTPKTVYWNLVGGGGTLGSVAWATSSGGTPATTNYPLGQDTAIVEDTGLNSGATLAWNSAFMAIPNLTFATRTLPVTFNIPINIYAVSNITLSSAVTRTGTQTVYFSGSTTLTSAGVTWSNGIDVYDSLTLGSNVTSSSGITLTAGTLNLANNNLTALTVTSTVTNTRAIQFGTGNITTTGSGAAFNLNGTNFTYTGTPTVNISNNSATAATVTSSSFIETNALNFNFTTGTYTLTFSGFVKNVNFTGFAGTLNDSARTIYGNFTFPASGISFSGAGQTTSFAATSGTQVITTNNATINIAFLFSGAGGTRELASDLTLTSNSTLSVERGTFNTNNFNVTAGSFNSTYSTARTINMGSGTWTVTGAATPWNIQTTTNLTLNPDTSTIVLSDTSVSTKTFFGGSLTYNNLTIGGTTGNSTFIIQDSNTFNTLSSTRPVAHTILFGTNRTQTITNFNINGTAGNIITIGSSTGANHTLAKAGGGTVTADYLSISRSTATPTLTWLATNSTDGGNNSGWYFGAFPPPSNGNFFLLF